MTDRAQAEKLRHEFARLRPEVIRPAKGFIRHDYTVPGGFYSELWDWDGFFTSLHLAGRREHGSRYMKNWVLNFLAASDEDGNVPGCITPNGPESGHRAFQMKPFIAQGAAITSSIAGDFGWLQENYAALVKVATLRESTNYDGRFGLFFWDTGVQSGADNNPALSNDMEDCRQILACDINAFQYREYLALSRIAAELGHDSDMEVFSARARDLTGALNVHLWSGEDETYWNLRRDTGEPVRRVTYSNFVPLWARMAPDIEGRKMITRYLLNENGMLADHGMRSLAGNDPGYNNEKIIWPHSNWSGPVWIIANYFYFMALMNYGFPCEADEMVDKLTSLCLSDIEKCGSMHENYNADTGEPLAPTSEQPPGGIEGGFVGWNLLLEDMLDVLEAGREKMQ